MKLLYCIGEGVGNCIMATPVIAAAREMGWEIDVVCRANFPGTLELIPGVIPLPEDFSVYDCILVSHWYLRPLNVKGAEVIRTSKPDFRNRSEVEVNMDLIRTVGYEGETPHTFICLDRKDLVSLPEIPFVTVSPGVAYKRWEAKKYPYYPELIERLNKEYSVVLVGGKEDRESLVFGGVSMDYIGRLSLVDTARLISWSDFFIGNDGGLMHLANALGIPAFGIFGPTSAVKNAEPDIMALSLGLLCQPCQFGFGFEKCKTRECMMSFPPDEIFDQITFEMEKRCFRS